MSRTVDYYFTPFSPYSYLGHRRFVGIAEAARAPVRVLPMDLAAVFADSGGLPLAQRAVQRQAYRLVDLARSAKALGLPLNLHPRFFPVNGDAASKLIVAVDAYDGSGAALRLAGAMLDAVWAQDRDIADADTLADLLAESWLPAIRVSQSESFEIAARYEAGTRAAIDVGVFGAPSYVVDGELFWGQDRLDLLERALV